MNQRFLFLQLGPEPGSGPTGHGVVFECDTKEDATACLLEKLKGEGATDARQTIPGFFWEGSDKLPVWYLSNVTSIWKKAIDCGPGSYFLAPPVRYEEGQSPTMPEKPSKSARDPLYSIEWADGRTDPEGALEWFSIPRLYTRAEARLIRDAIDCLPDIQDTRITEEKK